MVGMKLAVGTGKLRDVVVIKKVLYTEEKDTYSLECLSLLKNTKISLIMTVSEIKKCLMA